MKCICGCGVEVSEQRARAGSRTASRKCWDKLRKRRKRGGLVSNDTVICRVCGNPVPRFPKQRRKRYHEWCRKAGREANKAIREEAATRPPRTDLVNTNSGRSV